MRETRIIMGMSISRVVPDDQVRQQYMDLMVAEFAAVDAQFSPFKSESEISRHNRGETIETESTPRMRKILTLCETAKKKTGGYFDTIRGIHFMERTAGPEAYEIDAHGMARMTSGLDGYLPC